MREPFNPPISAARPRSSQKADKQGRVVKRSGNACTRCRAQKIKCSGTWPCAACQKRELYCKFEDYDQKVMVTKGYISDLQQRIAELEQTQTSGGGLSGTLRLMDDNGPSGIDGQRRSLSPMSTEREPTPAGEEAQTGELNGSIVVAATNVPRVTHQSPRHRSTVDPMTSTLTNPISIGAPTYMTAQDGRSYYLGTSSNWAFCRRILDLVHEHVHQTPVSPEALLFDSSTYDLGWNGLRSSADIDPALLPSLDHATYLVSAVKFHCSQMFHLFDETTFMNDMHDFYAEPESRIALVDLRYIHLLLVLALGRALVDKRSNAARLPGTDIFVKALQLLPDIHVLAEQPIISTEILCCIALYFQSLDFRQSAYQFIGQAMRMALGFGMHTNMPVHHLGEDVVERCREIWWTVYVLDREMTSLMGLPQLIDDESVYCRLPEFSDSTSKRSALEMRIRLARTIATINSKIYGPDGRLHKRFLANMRHILKDIADIADEVHEAFPVRPERMALSRVAAHIHLLYHQCIILATRPLLFCFLRMQFDSPESYFSMLNSNESIWGLIKKCMASSTQILSILGTLQARGLLETFLPFDLESLFVSTVSLVLVPALDARLQDNSTSWLKKSYELFDDISRSGNLVAAMRKSELQQLDELLSTVPPRRAEQDQHPSRTGLQGRNQYRQSAALATPHQSTNTSSDGTDTLGSFDYGRGFTGAHILDMALSLENIDVDWMSQAGIEDLEW